MMTKDGVETLTNKTLTSPVITGAVFAGSSVDSTFTIVDDGDATKILAFQVSGITTGTTRTLTVPDASDTLAVLGTVQTVTGAKTFGSAGAVGKLKVAGTTSGSTTLDTEAVAGTSVITIPAATDTLMGRGTADTITGVKTFGSAGAVGKLKIAGTTSGTTILDATAVAGTTTLTLPAATDTLVGLATTDTLTNKTLTSPAGTGFVIARTVTFTENATNTLHTGTVSIPAGAQLHDIRVMSTVLWTATTAVMKIGDGVDDDGWFTGVDLKATDLLVGEVLSISGSENWGGTKQGVYLVAATGRKGISTGGSGTGATAATSVIGVITVGTPATTAGRTFMTVTYSDGLVVAATPSA